MINNKLHKKYIVIFGTIFDNIYVNKYSSEDMNVVDDSSKTLIKSIKVPINYAKKDKLILKYLRREVSKKGVKMTLPRLSFNIVDYKYDSERKLNKTNTISIGTTKKAYTPVPYNLTFELNIITKKQSDNLKILEQIIPHFSPHLKFSSLLLDDFNKAFDLSLSLNNIIMNDENYDGKIGEERIITTTLYFNCKAWFFKTEEEIRKQIETIYINYLDLDSEEKYVPDESEILTGDDL